jgi:hypothetical protein
MIKRSKPQMGICRKCHSVRILVAGLCRDCRDADSGRAPTALPPTPHEAREPADGSR